MSSRTPTVPFHLLLSLGAFGVLVGPTACRSDAGEEVDAQPITGTCNATQQFAAFTRMTEAPILPPRKIASVDLAGGDAWGGLTLEMAEQTLCKATKVADVATNNADVDPEALTESFGWGTTPNFQVVFDVDKATRKVQGFQLNPGYKGSLEFRSRATGLGDPSRPNPFGQHTYSIGIGRPILRDGQPWDLHWMKPCLGSETQCWDREAAELFDGLMATFAPELPSTQESCIQEQSCLAAGFPTDTGSSGIFGVRPLGIYFSVPEIHAPAPEPSTPSFMYGFLQRRMPFSAPEVFLKLDDEGPIATARDIGDRRTTCTMKHGMTFQSFLADCVEVSSDPALNAHLRTKVLGNAHRFISGTRGSARGTWLLDVSGVNPNFNSERFDEEAPASTAKATELELDISATGRVVNELSPNPTGFPLVATGAIYREYARLTQAFLHAAMPAGTPRFPVGAPECLLPSDNPRPDWQPAPGCTGVEQLLTPAEPDTTNDAGEKRVSIGGQKGRSFGLRTVLRPGNARVVFCASPGDLDRCRGGDVPGVSLQSTIFRGTRDQIVTVLGGGDASRVPEAARDPKTFVQIYTQALVTYLRAAAGRPANVSTPEFAALVPALDEIKLTPGPGDTVTAKYKTRFELTTGTTWADISRHTYR